MEPITTAIIGFGYMGEWHYNNIIKSHCLDIRYAFDIDDERRKVATSYGLYVSDNINELLLNNNIRAFIIATPNDTHEYYIKLAIDYEKNIICEKPVTLSSESLAELIKLADSKKLRFTAHFNRRWDYDYQDLVSVVQSEIVGNINYIESRVCSSYGTMYGWRADSKIGGGLLYDWGPHLIDQALNIIKGHQVTRIDYTVKSIRTSTVDDYFRLKLSFSNGINYYIECGILSLIAVPRWRVYGVDGTVSGDSRLKVALFNNSHYMPIKLSKNDSSRLMSNSGMNITSFYWDRTSYNDHSDFYRNFQFAINGGTSLFVSSIDMMRVSSIIDAIKSQNMESGSISTLI